MMYSNYTDRLKEILSESRQRNHLSKGLSGFDGMTGQRKEVQVLLNEQRTFSAKSHLNLKPLNSILKEIDISRATLGHPDFRHLQQSKGIEYHYIVSGFIDIKGSTNLHKRHDLDVIYRITDTILNAAIHTCLSVGGHVQRLQGDAIFVYFGGKNIEKSEAVTMALTACSMFTYFVKNDLKNLFLDDGIEDINTRIGIDFGDDNDVLWANFGFMDVCELTTLSLHTSLANKMQAYANSNGIVVGQYIKDKALLDDNLFDLVRDSKGEVVKRYIFEDANNSFYYTQFSFDWYSFLKTRSFVKVDSSGKLFLATQSEDERRINKLRESSSLLATGGAYLDRQGKISNNPSGVHHEPHHFHYGQ